MKNTKNLIYICFGERENSEFLGLLNEFKKDYNFEIHTRRVGEACNPKEDVNSKKLFIVCADKESDMNKLREEHDKYKDKMKGETVLLIAPFELSSYKSNFNATEVLNCKDINRCRDDLKKVLDRVFMSGQSQMSGMKESPYIGQTNKQEYSTK